MRQENGVIALAELVFHRKNQEKTAKTFVPDGIAPLFILGFVCYA
jgi:hypothetical protein